MKQFHLKLAAIAFLLSGAVSTVSAQSPDRISIVTTAVPFLRISPDARAGGMGETGIATLPDANAPFWNLAKTPFNTNNAGIAMTYTPWLKDLGLNDVYLASLAGYLKPSDQEALSLSVRYFSLGTIQFTDAGGNFFSSERPREFSIDMGYSRKLSDQMGVGLALRYIRSRLAVGTISGTTYKPGSTVAADLSWYYNGQDENGEGWSAGAVLSNLGGKIGYTTNADERDYIPANLGLGGAYTKVFDEANKVIFALDINKLMVPTPPQYEELLDPSDPDYDPQAEDRNLQRSRDYRSKGIVGSWFSSFGDAPGGFGEELKEFTFSAGAEYWYNEQFALRAGYFYENKDKGNRKYFTVGAGIRYNAIGINFSYLVPSGQGITRNPLSNTLRFGLAFDLNGGE